MKMADLPGRIVSPLGKPIKTKAQVAAASGRDTSDALNMEVGETIVVHSEGLARRLNQRHGLGMFSNKKVDGVNYLVRNY